MIETNRKRTYQMFAETPTAEELEQIGHADKVKAYAAKYQNLGKIPGVSTTDVMRARALKDLGIESKVKMAPQESVVPDISAKTQKALPEESKANSL